MVESSAAGASDEPDFVFGVIGLVQEIPEEVIIQRFVERFLALLQESEETLRESGQRRQTIRLFVRCTNAVETRLACEAQKAGRALRVALQNDPSTFESTGQMDLRLASDTIHLAVAPDLKEDATQIARFVVTTVADNSDCLIVAGNDPAASLQEVTTLLSGTGREDLLVVFLALDGSTGGLVSFDPGRAPKVLTLHDLSLALIRRRRERRFEAPLLPEEQPQEPGWTVGCWYEILLRILTFSREKIPFHTRIGDFGAKAKAALEWPDGLPDLFSEKDRERLRGIESALAFPFTVADLMGIYYANLYRLVCIVIPALQCLAVAGAFALFFASGAMERVWLLSEMAALALMAAVLAWSRSRSLQERWIEYRMIAEFMRPAPYYLLLGQTFSPRPPELKEQETTRWRQVVRRYQQLMRTRLAPGIVLSARYLFGVREMVKQFALEQRDWHRGFADRHLHYYRGLVRIGVWAFIAELLFVLAHVLVHAPVWRPALLVSTCLPAAIGFATAIAVHQFGFEQIAERSTRAVERLERLLRDVEGRPGEVRLADLLQWTGDLASILAEEQNSWYRQTLRLGAHL